MAVSSDPPAAATATTESKPAEASVTTDQAQEHTTEKKEAVSHAAGNRSDLPPLQTTAKEPAPAAAQDKSQQEVLSASPDGTTLGGACDLPPLDPDGINPVDFQGAVDTNNDLPSEETIRKLEDYVVLDRDGRTHTFKSLYAGKHVARRVLVIFVRHFFCGNCQEFLRTLSASVTPESLLSLPISTFIAVVGCGDPGLIDMYARETGCPFPVYSDPTAKLYEELGMVRTLQMGSRPAYMANKGILKSSIESVVQGLRNLHTGLVLKMGPQRQIGGEFLFEPLSVASPISTPWAEKDRQIGNGKPEEEETGTAAAELDGEVEAKRVTWCHRMKTTRDHAEIPELMEVLGLDGQGRPIKDDKRWTRAIRERKGTGSSMARQMSEMKPGGQSALAA